MNRLQYKIFLAVMALAITAYYFFINPNTGRFTFPCLFKETTGFYCLGCGGQRAFHALLHGKFNIAFQDNLLIFIALPLVFIIIIEEIFEKKIVSNFLQKAPIIWLISIIVLVFWITRNLPYPIFDTLRPLP